MMITVVMKTNDNNEYDSAACVDDLNDDDE